MSTIVSNTLTKFAAHARWLIEQSGTDPEAAQVIISVKGPVAMRKLCETIKKFTDDSGDVLFKDERGVPSVFRVHGVTIACVRQIAP